MKKIVWLAVVQLLLLSFAAFADDLTKDEVNDIVMRMKSGKAIDIHTTYPAESTQVLWISMPSFQYMIDIRAKLCFVQHFGTSIAPVPCKSLKSGYPLLAPIMNWE